MKPQTTAMVSEAHLPNACRIIAALASGGKGPGGNSSHLAGGYPIVASFMPCRSLVSVQALGQPRRHAFAGGPHT